MAEFEAKITGIADLSKAKQAFDAFKTEVSKPITITLNTAGVNAQLNSIQKQFTQAGVNVARQFNKGFESNLKTDIGHESQKKLISGWNDGFKNNSSALNSLNATRDVLKQIQREIDSVNTKGLSLEKLKFDDTGTKFTAKAVGEMGTLVNITGKWRDAVKEADGSITPGKWEIIKNTTVDLQAGMKQAQTEATKLAEQLEAIKAMASNNGIEAQMSKIRSSLANMGDGVDKDAAKKAYDYAIEYQRAMTKVQDSLNGKATNPLQGQDLVDMFNRGQQALVGFNNTMTVVNNNAKAFGINTGNAAKQAQAEVEKVAKAYDKIKQSIIGETDRSGYNIKNGQNQIDKYFGQEGIESLERAKKSLAEYKQLMSEVRDGVTGVTPMSKEDVVAKYDEATQALKRFGVAMEETRATQSETLRAGEADASANKVEAWANRNTKALKKYGNQLDEIAQKMRNAKTADELKGYQREFNNLKAEAVRTNQIGLSFGDSIKRAFAHIGAFTGIYAITSQLRQLPREMAQEVIKIDTAMTELRKVSTASASEITSYFEQATESASKYGQTIDEVINSTASWTRLGYDLKDASTLTDVTAQLAQVGSGLNVDTATEGLQATIRGFGLAADEAKRVGDMINYIADTEPIDAIGIINGLERSSSAMSEANNSLEETIGLITASTSVTQDATAAGTAWRTIAMRIRGKNLCLHTGKVRVRCCA